MAVKGKGAAFHITVASVLTKVAEVLSITPPEPTRDTIDTTHHDSTGDYREFIASLMDAGEATITLHYVPGSTGDTNINAALASGALTACAIDVNSATATQQRLSFSGIITGYARADVVIDDKMTASLTIKVSGPMTQGAKPV